MLGGFEPNATVGSVAFSLVPCVKESSPEPDARSCLTVTPDVLSVSVPVPVPAANCDQSMQGEPPSLVRLAPACAPNFVLSATGASISKLLWPNAPALSVLAVAHVVAAAMSWFPGKTTTSAELAMTPISAMFPRRLIDCFSRFNCTPP